MKIKTQIKSALVSVVLMAILSIIVYILGVGDIFAVNVKIIVNIGVMSLLSGIASLIKSSFTTEAGKFAGVKVK